MIKFNGNDFKNAILMTYRRWTFFNFQNLVVMKRTQKNWIRVHGNNNKADVGTNKIIKYKQTETVQATTTTEHADVTRHTAEWQVGIVNIIVLCYIEFEENNQESRSPLWSRKRVNVERQTSAVRPRGSGTMLSAARSVRWYTMWSH